MTARIDGDHPESPEGRARVRAAERTFGFAAAASLALAAALARLVFGRWCGTELTAGWTLGTANGLIALWFDHKAVGFDSTRFLLWGLVLNGFRVAAMAVAIVLIARTAPLDTEPFVVAALTTYFVFMAGEIRTLYVRSVNGPAGQTRGA